MKTYHVFYCMESVSEPKGVDVLANNAPDAYDKAVYETIPELEGSCPYGAWVHSVTYNNGNYKLFNTCMGKAY